MNLACAYVSVSHLTISSYLKATNPASGGPKLVYSQWRCWYWEGCIRHKLFARSNMFSYPYTTRVDHEWPQNNVVQEARSGCLNTNFGVVHAAFNVKGP